MKTNIKKQQKYLLKQKENLRIFIDYLVDSYYLNPRKELSFNDIKIQLNIENCLIVEEFFAYIIKEKYIKLRKNKFLINFIGFNYLESLQNSNKQYQGNLISLVISMAALVISLFVLIWSDSVITKIILFIILIIFMIYIFKFINDILNKKYY